MRSQIWTAGNCVVCILLCIGHRMEKMLWLDTVWWHEEHQISNQARKKWKCATVSKVCDRRYFPLNSVHTVGSAKEQTGFSSERWILTPGYCTYGIPPPGSSDLFGWMTYRVKLLMKERFHPNWKISNSGRKKWNENTNTKSWKIPPATSHFIWRETEKHIADVQSIWQRHIILGLFSFFLVFFGINAIPLLRYRSHILTTLLTITMMWCIHTGVFRLAMSWKHSIVTMQISALRVCFIVDMWWLLQFRPWLFLQHFPSQTTNISMRWR